MKHDGEIKLEIKEVGDDGTFTGFGSVYGNVDEGGDVVEEGAFTRTIKANKGETKILWQHDYRNPIGTGKVEDTKKGLKVTAEVNLDTQRGREAFSDIKKGIVDGLSIGYQVVKHLWEGPIRRLKELKLHEISVVTFPMNTRATITAAKATVRFQDLPLAGRDRAWDASAARKRIRTWAGASENLEDTGVQKKFRRAFTWFNSEEQDTLGGYKLPIADIVDGKLTAIPRAVFAAAAVVQGARGGAAIPSGDLPSIRTHLGRYYSKMDLTPPWEEESRFSGLLTQVIGYSDTLKSAEGIELSKIDRVLIAKARESLESLSAEIETHSDTDGDSEADPPDTGDDKGGHDDDDKKAAEAFKQDLAAFRGATG